MMTHKVDVMSICETKLTPRDKLKITDYVIYRKDRPDAVNAGGVALLIHKNIPHIKINQNLNNNIELTGVKLTNGIHIYAAYNKPSSRFTVNDLDAIFNTATKVIVAGDFNSKHPTWNCNRANPNGNMLLNYAYDSDIKINFPDQHTHHPSNNMTPTTIDIILTKNVDELQKPVSLPELDS
ncbi:hypothetical protein MTP99_014375, partial [Tenebrio molitor]